MGNVQVAKTPQLSKESVLTHAREVFGDAQKTYSWLTTPNNMFGGMRPRDLIDLGAPEDLLAVDDEICRIDNGLF